MRERTNHLRIGAATMALVAGTGLASASAYGEEIAQPSAGIEEIVVTAQRRAESLQNVPIAITALTATEIERSGIRTSQDIAVVTPGLTATTNRSGLTPYLRGVGTQSNNVDGSIAVYVDNVYYGSTAGSIFAMNNVERVEVLKGPQGTLFGRNATGGLIHVITRDPSDIPELRASIGYGNYDTVTGSVYATTGLAPGVAMNVAAYGSNQGEGWGRNVNTGDKAFFRNEWSVRSKLRLDLGDQARLILSGDYSEFETDIGSQRQVMPGAYTARSPTGVIYQHVGGFYDINSSIPLPADFGPGLKGRTYGFSGNLNINLSDDITLTSITAYRNYRAPSYLDNDLTPERIVDAFFADAAKTFQQEILLNGTSGRLKWTAGGIYYHSDVGHDPFIVVSSYLSSQNYSYVADITTKSWAVYGQASYDLADRTTFTLGGRYTVDRMSIFNERHGLDGSPMPTWDTASAPYDRTHKKWSKPTWRVSLDHKFTPDILAYASYNRGYKAGAFNPGTPPSLGNPSPRGDAVNPETLDAYEVGFKSDLLDRQLRLNASAFYYDYKNIQLVQLYQLQPGVVGTSIFNASSATIKGLELETVFAPRIPTGRLQLRVSGSLTDGEYGDFPGAPATVPNDPSVGGNANVSGGINASGNRVVRTPKFSSTTSVDYTIPVSSQHELGFNFTWQYSGRYYFEVDNRVSQQPTNIVNGHISLGREDEGWRVRLWGRNLANEKYFTTVNTSGGGDGGSPAAPRTYGVTLDVKFGGS